MWLDGGTTVHNMLEFIQVISDAVGHANEQNFYVFIKDNLHSHKNEAIIALIHLYGHAVDDPVPCWPVDDAIKFVFDTIQTSLVHRCTQQPLEVILLLQQMNQYFVLIHLLPTSSMQDLFFKYNKLVI